MSQAPSPAGSSILSLSHHVLVPGRVDSPVI